MFIIRIFDITENIKENFFYYIDMRNWSANNNNYFENLARSKKCMAFIQIMQSSKKYNFLQELEIIIFIFQIQVALQIETTKQVFWE